jgi:hypothetical protein
VTDAICFLAFFLFSFGLDEKDKKLKSIVSSRKKASRKKKQGGQLPPGAEEVDWEKVGTSMDKDARQCKKRYEFLRLCLGGKGPVPWTREEDKQILILVTQHGMSGKLAYKIRLLLLNA